MWRSLSLIWFQVLESVKKGTKGQKVFNHKSIAVHQVKMCVIVWDSFAVLLNYQGVDTMPFSNEIVAKFNEMCPSSF